MNTKVVRQLLTEVAILKETIKKLYCLRKGYEYKENISLCAITRSVFIINWFYSLAEYKIKDEFLIYRGSDNKKIQTALKMSEYTECQKDFKRNPNTTFMWNLDVYGWQYRVMFCEGLVEEKIGEVRSRLNNCSLLFRLYVCLLTGIKKS